MGRPLIATDMPGCRDAVKDGITGILCAPRDHVSLADAMTKVVVAGGEKRKRIGQAGRNLVEKEFDENHVIDRYLETLQEIST